MRVFNEEKTQELTAYDLTKGYLKSDKLITAHHESVEAVAEKGYYEVAKEYPNGGRDVKWIVEVPAVEGKEAYDEEEEIRIYIPYTEKELSQIEINELKGKLRATDYQAIKFAEGELTEEEYAQTRLQRKAWRERINALEEV
jgi:FtsZ-binding cell division protein ZapB